MVTRGGGGCRRLRGWRVFDGFEEYTIKGEKSSEYLLSHNFENKNSSNLRSSVPS